MVAGLTTAEAALSSNLISSRGDENRGDVKNQGWKAELTLGFTDRGDKTVVSHKAQLGPLAIQRPLYPEGDVCHTYLLHPPGGVVGGDELLIKATTEIGAHALVTTPGATKFYRSEGKVARQKQILTVKAGSCLEWLPQENIFFPTAQVRIDTDIHIETGALFMGWELHCFGRPALKECFEGGKVWGKTQVFVDEKRILTENVQLEGGNKSILNSGLQGFPMMGSFFITAQTENDLRMVQDLLQDLASHRHFSSGNVVLDSELVIAATQIQNLIVVRALGHWTEPMLEAFTLIWQQIRLQWFDSVPEPPRIWAT
ncbi:MULTISPECIES: urease accessory protein UreD [Vibrio]|uniref:Urease accessory protein UreD n=1 Tax=Vibrio casei TaxID=673372 RepID=A0A368LIT7_9VIBR|nr:MULTISPECIES: urease accessory protein UreD [Vibrio]RCS70535.1 urease accessory protein UreD [Vibrio casei]SJN27732.1 Urease accessory protein UreD [Vibrio casei]HBV77868.1 urease accessory protein ureD [Vibrio sp.]